MTHFLRARWVSLFGAIYVGLGAVLILGLSMMRAPLPFWAVVAWTVVAPVAALPLAFWWVRVETRALSRSITSRFEVECIVRVDARARDWNTLLLPETEQWKAMTMGSRDARMRRVTRYGNTLLLAITPESAELWSGPADDPILVARTPWDRVTVDGAGNFMLRVDRRDNLTTISLQLARAASGEPLTPAARDDVRSLIQAHLALA
ncbi:hypothetical protein [Agromyces binzhouensis]|uniref:hypothetical protein n=1 Tax=Agromyces binzhouensis TaxID=1817495 RepID=UPI003634A007